MLILLLLQLSAADSRGVDTFKARVAAFDTRARELTDARGVEARGKAALAWLQALGQVCAAVPFERKGNPIFNEWLDRHRALVVYSEPAGQWFARHDVISKIYDEHRTSSSADGIAWTGVTTPLPGECEGFVPCYASRLNVTQGEYLRRRPDGRHRTEVFQNITKSIRSIVEDLLTSPRRTEFLNVPNDCADLIGSLAPLRHAVDATGGPAAVTPLIEIDRLRAFCP